MERVLGRGAVAVLIVPELAALGQKLRRFEQLKVASFLAPTQGFSDSRALVDALVGQLGVDVRSPEALEAAGIDGSGPGGASVLVSGQVYLALPVKDAGKLGAALAAVAQRRLGAGLASERRVESAVVKTFARAAGGPPVLGYVLARGFALVAVGDGIAGLPAMATLPESDSLAKEPALLEARRRLGGPAVAYAYLPPGSPVLGQLPVTSALVALGLEATAFSLTLDAPLRPGSELGGALMRQAAAVDLSALLPADAFMIAGYDGAPAALAPVARQLLGRWVEGSGVDLEVDVLAHVRPGVVAALTLAERPPLGRGLPSLQLGRTNPFTYVGLSGVAPLDGADAGVAALQQAVALAPRLGAEMKRQDRGGATAFLTYYSQGEGVHFAVRGARAYFASPVERLDSLLAGAEDGRGAGRAGEGEGAALWAKLDLAKLAQSVRDLPESAWGLGGFAMKGTALRWLEAIDDLRALTLELGAHERVLSGRLSLVLAPPEGPEPTP